MKLGQLTHPELSGLAIAVLASILLGLGVSAVNMSTEAALAVVTAVVLAAPIVYRIARGRFDLFEPITFFVIVYALLFVVRPAYILATSEFTFAIGRESINFSGQIVDMQVAALFGAIAFVAGYEILRVKSLQSEPRKPRKLNPGTLKMGGLILVVLGCLGTLLYLSSIPGGYAEIIRGRSTEYHETSQAISSYIYYAPDLLVPGALTLFVVWLKSRQLWPLVVAVAAFCLLLAIRLPVGSRLTLLPLVAGPVIFYFMYRGRRPGLATTVVGVVLIAVVWSLILQTRYEDSGSETRSFSTALTSIVDEPTRLLNPITDGRDLAMAPGLAAAMAVIPEEVPFQYGGATVGDFVVRGIPRQIWDAKPIPPREQVTGAIWPEGYAARIANPEYSVLFHFFVDAWYFGVLLGMCLYGFLFRALRDFTVRGAQDPLILLIYAVLLCNIPMLLRDSPTDSFIRLGFNVLPIVIVAWIAGRHSKRRRAVARLEYVTDASR